MLLEGLHIPFTTPFHPDGRLALHKLESNVARYSKTPAAGLIVLDPSAEPTLLNDEETREVLSTAAQSAAPEKVLIAGISRDSVRSTLALADFAAEQSCDAVLIGKPGILAPQHTLEILTWFQTIADRSALPVILLSTYSCGRSLAPQLIAKLASHPNIIGLCLDQQTCNRQDESGPGELQWILTHTAAHRREITVTPTFAAVTRRMRIAPEASRNSAVLISAQSLSGAAATALAEPPTIPPPLRTRTKTVGFQIIAAATPTLLADLRAGASGIAPAFAACAPQACYEVLAAWKDSDQPLAEEKQSRLIAAAALAEASPAALKFACDLNGYFGGSPQLPNLPIDGTQRNAIERALTHLRN